MSDLTRRRRSLVDRFAAIDDGVILRTAFYGMLAATVYILATDYLERSALMATLPEVVVDPQNPVLPSVLRPEIDPNNPAFRPTEQITTAPDALGAPLEISLIGGGVLRLVGTIIPGSAERLAAELAARGEYIQTIAIDSPGGSVQDALAMGRAIREGGYTTAVGDGALCASSCPLVLAGGVERLVSDTAAVGVHQIYALASPDSPIGPAQAMSDAQSTTALITRHLRDLDVDAALWLHALETPPDRLYYLTSEELDTYRLRTPPADDAPEVADEPVPLATPDVPAESDETSRAEPIAPLPQPLAPDEIPQG